jgi:hypothetical protein
MHPLTLDEILARCHNNEDPAQRRQNLSDVLEPDEAIFGYVCPARRLLLATEKRMVSARLQREGFSRPGVTWITAVYDYEDISAVQYIEATPQHSAYLLVHYLGSDLVIPDAPHLQAFYHTLNDLMHRWKAKRRATSPIETETGNLSAQLRELHALYQSGVLDADEYAAAKRKLIGA